MTNDYSIETQILFHYVTRLWILLKRPVLANFLYHHVGSGDEGAISLLIGGNRSPGSLLNLHRPPKGLSLLIAGWR